jgi:glycosyltransferase involved in cell wall biosynthesis
MEKVNPIISIIIPTFNSEDVIRNCLQSILFQSANEIEVIIFDGVSVDNTESIVFSLKKTFEYHGIKLTYKSEPDNGVYDAMNKSLSYATGDWILFLGSDDLLIPHAIRRIKQYLKYTDRIYYGDSYRPNSNKLYDGSFNKFKLCYKNINHQCILYPRTVFEKYRYDTQYKILSDYNLNIQLSGDKSFKLEYIPVLISYYEDINKGISGRLYDNHFYVKRNDIIKLNLGTIYFVFSKVRGWLGNIKRLF